MIAMLVKRLRPPSFLKSIGEGEREGAETHILTPLKGELDLVRVDLATLLQLYFFRKIKIINCDFEFFFWPYLYGKYI
jgi:hypothetical protein